MLFVVVENNNNYTKKKEILIKIKIIWLKPIWVNNIKKNKKDSWHVLEFSINEVIHSFGFDETKIK